MLAKSPYHIMTEPTGSAEFTKAVVAICVLLVPAAAVGAIGTPVRVTLLNGVWVDRSVV
jgi:hypothetical protein